MTALAVIAAGAVTFASTSQSPAPKADAIVATDGSGQYRTVQDAINAAPQTTSAGRRWVIFVKAGTYRELVYIQREKRFVSLVGEDPTRTIVTHQLKATDAGLDGLPIGTFRTATVVIDADDFSAENLTFENAAGPVGQALAVRVDGDRVVFRNTRFLGWQDTMLLNRGRQYIEDSLITGHVDFVFGGATAWFARCHVHVWRDGYITAPSTPPDQPFGFVFVGGRITGAMPEVRTYLGRPWRDFGATTFVDTAMSEVVRPAGWHNWDKPEREQTSRFAEGSNSGPGAAVDARVAWSKRLTAADARALSMDRVLAGNDRWDPRTVPAHPSAVRAVGGALPSAPGQVSPARTQPAPAVTWATILRQPAAWYGSPEALAVVATVRAAQRTTGGWPKNTDWTTLRTAADLQALRASQTEPDSTIDNGATVTELRFLARVHATAPDATIGDAFLRGIDYLLTSQYGNGGWPQYFPLRTDYSRHITFNDDAMTGVALLLKDIAQAVPGFELVDLPRRQRCADAVSRAITLILRTQIRVNSVRMGWCQQYDADSLSPTGARTYEHPSIASKETVAIARLLIGVPDSSPAIVAAVDAAAAWLRQVELKNVPEATAPGLWARFYEIGTNRPIYSGRDGVIKYRLAEIEAERRDGYSWVGPYAAAFLASEYPKWRQGR